MQSDAVRKCQHLVPILNQARMYVSTVSILRLGESIDVLLVCDVVQKPICALQLELRVEQPCEDACDFSSESCSASHPCLSAERPSGSEGTFWASFLPLCDLTWGTHPHELSAITTCRAC